MLTGEYPHQCGMFGLAHRGWSLNDYRHHIVHLLRDAGYRTTLLGFQHVAPWDRPEVIGYDEVLAPEAARPYAPDLIPHAQAFLRQASRSRPWFLSLGTVHTHRFGPRQLFSTGDAPAGDPRYVRPPAPVPDSPQTRQDMADYLHAAAQLDRLVGNVLDELDEQGLSENTLVIHTTDHGLPMPRMKCTLFDGGIGVNLILRLPCCPGLCDGKVIDSLVSQVDLVPTLCNLLDIATPARAQGVSLIPLVRGELPSVRDEIFAETNYHGGLRYPQRCIRTERYKYIRRYGDNPRPLPFGGDGPSQLYWIERGYEERPQDAEMLYDVVFDPNEQNNLAGRGDMSAVMTDLSRRLDSWMRKTSDPLADGKLPRPGTDG